MRPGRPTPAHVLECEARTGDAGSLARGTDLCWRPGWPGRPLCGSCGDLGARPRARGPGLCVGAVAPRDPFQGGTPPLGTRLPSAQAQREGKGKSRGLGRAPRPRTQMECGVASSGTGVPGARPTSRVSWRRWRPLHDRKQVDGRADACFWCQEERNVVRTSEKNTACPGDSASKDEGHGMWPDSELPRR